MYLGNRNPRTDCYKILHAGCRPGRNYACQFWRRSVKGFWCGEGSNFGLFHWLASSPLKHSRTTVRVCDIRDKYTCGYKLKKIIKYRDTKIHKTKKHNINLNEKLNDITGGVWGKLIVCTRHWLALAISHGENRTDCLQRLKSTPATTIVREYRISLIFLPVIQGRLSSLIKYHSQKFTITVAAKSESEMEWLGV